MKLYIAGPWKELHLMSDIAAKFEAAGHTITWKWWATKDIPETHATAHLLMEQAKNDINGVGEADTLILINSAKSEGKAVEQGVAIALDIPIIAVGKRGEHSLNVFHYLPIYTWVDNVEDAIEVLHRQERYEQKAV